VSVLAAPWPARLRTVTGAVIALHAVGLALVCVSGDARYLGAALVAYALGLRHGLDADHLSAIDNATRRLIAQRRSPVGAGFFFSVGHTLVVLGAVVIVALCGGEQWLAGSSLAQAGALSGGILTLVIGALNVSVLRSVVKREPRTRVNILGRLGGRATSPLGLLCVGTIFGLGLDSAAAVLILVSGGVPLPALLGLPVVFGAAMALVDTADGELMRRLYAWAVDDARRGLRANVLLTAGSVAFAFAIGTYEVLRGLH
jgi:high-affinity nickel-transport protein